MSINSLRALASLINDKKRNPLDAFLKRPRSHSPADLLQPLESRQMLSSASFDDSIVQSTAITLVHTRELTFSQGKNQVVTTPTGAFTFALTGSGTGTLTLTDTNDFLSILITGSKSNSNFTVTSAAASPLSPAPRADIGSITIGVDGDAAVDSIGAIQASPLNLISGAMHVEGGASRVLLHDITKSSITIQAPAPAGVSFVIEDLNAGVINVNGLISSLIIYSADADSSVTAKSISKLASIQNFDADLTLTGAASGNTLASAVLASGENSVWNITGNVGQIQGVFHGITINAQKIQRIEAYESSLLTVSAASIATLSARNLSHSTFTAATFNSILLTGSTDGLTLTASGKITAIAVQGNLSNSALNFTSVQSTPQSALGTLTVSGVASSLSINSSNINNALGNLIFTSRLDGLNINAPGDIHLIKTHAANALVINSARDIKAIHIQGNLSNSVITAHAITGYFNIYGTVENTSIFVNDTPSSVLASPVNALNSLYVASSTKALKIQSSNINSRIGTLNFGGDFSNGQIITSGVIGTLTGRAFIASKAQADIFSRIVFSQNVGSAQFSANYFGGIDLGESISTTYTITNSTSAAPSYGIAFFNARGDNESNTFKATNALAKLGTFKLGLSSSNDTFSVHSDVASIATQKLSSFNFDGHNSGSLLSLTVNGNLDNARLDVQSMQQFRVAGNMANTTLNITGGIHKTSIYVGMLLTHSTITTTFALGHVYAKTGIFDSSIIVNTAGGRSKDFIALAGLSADHSVSYTTITGVNANSNVGTLSFPKGVDNSTININGRVASLNATSLTQAHITAESINTASVSKLILDATLKLNPNATLSVGARALGSLNINGDATHFTLDADRPNSNIGSVTISGMPHNNKFNINGNWDRLSAPEINDTNSFTVSGQINAIRITAPYGSLGGNFNAGSISTLYSRNNLTAHVVTGSGGIGSITASIVLNAMIRTQGSIGSITALTTFNSIFLSGYNPALPDPTSLPSSSSDFTNTSATIGSITLGQTNVFPTITSTIIAGYKIGSVSLKVVTEKNDGKLFGIQAVDSIGRITRIDPATKKPAPVINGINNPSQNFQSNDFVLRVLP
jgi:hypothetical protein